eukprot:sb/3462489/
MRDWEVYDSSHFDPEISLCKSLHEHFVPMFLSNERPWGWLKEPSTLNDLLFYRNATQDWETKYILKVPKTEDYVKTGCSAHIHKASGVLKENFGKDLVAALGSKIVGYQEKPEQYQRPGYDLTQTPYNETLVDVLMRLSTHVISDLFPQYTPKHKLYDLRIHEVEGSEGSRQLVGNPAAYQLIMPLNNPYQEDEKERFSFYRQNCTVGDVDVGDILLFPGRVTHTAKPIQPTTGMFLYLSASFDPDDYQKYSNGTWREWAADNSTRQQINNSVLYTYYTCYTLLTFSIFILLPFSYFFFEEGDADADVPVAERCCTAFKYSACFIFLVSALLLCGAFIQFGSIPNTNGTTIDDLKYLGDQIKERGVEAALSTTISVCTIMGLFVFILYTAYGLSAFPLNFIKARGSAAKELEKLNCNRIVRDEEERLLVSKYADGRPMIPADRRRMEKLRADKHRYNELERLLDSERQSCWIKIQIFLRPFSIVLGIVLLLLSIAFMSSLGVTLADKFVYSNFTMGYFLSATHYHYNPMNFILTEAQHIFPIDYVLITLLVFYVAACTVNGIRRIGIWFFWVKVFEVVPHRTMPQGLLILSGLFSCAMVALNQVVLVALPTYATYGSQHYRNGTGNVTVVPCDNHAPPGDCQLTQFASIIARFTLHANLYGAIVTYLIAAFVVVRITKQEYLHYASIVLCFPAFNFRGSYDRITSNLLFGLIRSSCYDLRDVTRF